MPDNVVNESQGYYLHCACSNIYRNAGGHFVWDVGKQVVKVFCELFWCDIWSYKGDKHSYKCYVRGIIDTAVDRVQQDIFSHL
jgi:hypothetical protein